jgi:hypothetical protein
MSKGKGKGMARTLARLLPHEAVAKGKEAVETQMR